MLQSKVIYDSIDLKLVKWIDSTRKTGFVLKNLVEELGHNRYKNLICIAYTKFGSEKIYYYIFCT